MTYTVCIVKATRDVVFIESGLSFKQAVSDGNVIYEHTKILKEFMATGVAVIVVADENFEKFLTNRHSWGKLTAYQFGSY